MPGRCTRILMLWCGRPLTYNLFELLMIRRIKILMAICLILIGCAGCRKEDPDFFLVGTAWECVEEPEILVFNDNHTGIYYVKSAIDGVYDEIYSSFDFTYEISGKCITVQIFFSHFDSLYDFVIVDDETLTCGDFILRKSIISRKEGSCKFP